jgi:FkbM family methyltransferase
MRGRLTRAGIALLGRLGYDVERLDPGAVLVTRRSVGDRQELGRFGAGATLVSRPRVAAREWMKQEKPIFEHLQSTQVPALLGMYGVNCVIDVGAHEGQYAQRLRAGGYRGRIVSFEPTPAAFEVLERASADDPSWSVHRLALGREDGSTTMNAVPGTLSSILPATKFGAGRYPKLQAPEAIEVELRRLDGLLDELLDGLRKPRPYLKLDTQGFDLDVFAGAGDAIGRFVGMQSEVALMEIYRGMPRMPEALAAYEAAGFELAGLYPVSRQTRTARVLEYDAVLVRAALLKPKGR